jgi:hypothetical protein
MCATSPKCWRRRYLVRNRLNLTQRREGAKANRINHKVHKEHEDEDEFSVLFKPLSRSLVLFVFFVVQFVSSLRLRASA